MKIGGLDAPSYRVCPSAPDKGLVVLAIALGDRVQGFDNVFGKALRTKPVEGPAGAVLADIVQHRDDALVG
jgi:hypothetical protein